jgi:predicted phosphodiesterase
MATTNSIAVISDLHLGANLSTLVNVSNGQPQVNNDVVEKIKDSIVQSIGNENNLSYLIILGDLFDQSLASYKDVWSAAKAFFHSIEDLADNIVYVPGNHDFSMWHYFEQDICITSKAKVDQPLKDFNYSVPGVFYPNADGNLTCEPLDKLGLGKLYDGGYFRNLWWPEDSNKQFIVIYPNLYFVEASGDTTLLTHGQYFDPFWSILGHICLDCIDSILPGKKYHDKNSIKELVELNYTTSLLDSSDMGGAGIFSEMVRKVNDDIAQQDYHDIDPIKASLLKHIGELIELNCLEKTALKIGLSMINPKKKTTPALNNPNYVLERMANICDYLLLSLKEISGYKLPNTVTNPITINRLIFGHTHIPSKPDDPVDKSTATFTQNSSAICRNTGGWVLDKNKQFNAGIAIYNNNSWQMCNIDQKGIGQPFAI